MPYTARALSLLALSVCASALALPTTPIARAAEGPQIRNEGSAKQITGQYIFSFPVGHTAEQMRAARDEIRRLGGMIVHSFPIGEGLRPGLVVRFPAGVTADQLRAVPGVASISADQKAAVQSVQENPPEGLDRIDRRSLPLDKLFQFTRTGADVDVYVLDTGIDIDHDDFGGRAQADWSYDTADRGDCSGHGTHVAGIIGGTRFGVAKGVRLHSVRVADQACQLSEGTIRAGIAWVTAEVKALGGRAVANLSASSNISADLDQALKDSIAAGVTYVVAAGNIAQNACKYALTGVEEAIVVSATEADSDTRWASSNFGSCVDLFAPGVGIESAIPDSHQLPCGSDSMVSTTPGYRSQMCTGTSGAAPHVAGCAALDLQGRSGDDAAPAKVRERLLDAANKPDTPGWGGISGRMADDPNVLVQCRAN